MALLSSVINLGMKAKNALMGTRKIPSLSGTPAPIPTSFKKQASQDLNTTQGIIQQQPATVPVKAPAQAPAFTKPVAKAPAPLQPFPVAPPSLPKPIQQLPEIKIAEEGPKTDQNIIKNPITGASIETTQVQQKPDSNSVLSELRKKYLESLAPTQEESDLSDELAQFRGQAREGIAGLEGQGRGIPLSLVRGQQAQLEEQAGIKEQTLMDRLAAQSALRQQSATASKEELRFAGEDIAAEKTANTPIEVGGALVKLNPKTGQYESVFKAQGADADGFTLSEGQARYDASGNLVAGSAGDPLKRQKAELEIKKLEQELSGGGLNTYDQQLKALQLEKLRQEVTGTKPAGPKDVAANANRVNQTQSAIDALIALSINPALESRVGVQGFMPAIPGTSGATFDGQLGQLKALLTAPALSALKGLGAMSDREFNTIVASIGNLNRNLPQEDFKAELQRIHDNLQSTLVKLNAGPATGAEGGEPPSQEEIQLMRDSGYSDQEILDWQNSFTSDLSKSQNGSIKVAVDARSFPKGANGGQCGRFVNNITGIGMGDSYQSKLAKCDPSIGTPQNPPKPGDVFVMPYSWTGHTGIVTKVTPKPDGTYELSVTDSNYKLNEKVEHHKLNSSSIEAYARPS